MNTESEQIQIVTALFDIQRESHDGRSVAEYLNYLGDILNKYSYVIVFHDCIPQSYIESYPETNFCYLEISDLPLFANLKDIKEVNEKYSNCPEADLVNKSDHYGIVINSKIHLLALAGKISESPYLLWIDAGISRFNLGKFPSVPKKDFSKFSKYQAVFQIDIRNWLRNFRVFKSPSNWISPGSSTRVIGSGIFLLSREFVPELDKVLMKYVLENLRLGIWDTEQVNLFFVLASYRILYIIQKKNDLTLILDNIFSPNKVTAHSIYSKIIRRFLRY
jgi:hypothetical protein